MSRYLKTIDNYSFDKILLTESRRLDGMNPSTFNWFATPPTTPITIGQAVNFGNLTTPAGRAWIINEITASASDRCAIYINLAINSANIAETGSTSFLDEGILQQLSGVIPEGGGTIRFTLPQPMVCWEGTRIAASYIRDVTEPVGAQLCIQGIDLTADFNFNADKKIAVIGDSVTWTSGGSGTAGHSYWPFLVTSGFKQKGESVRLINKGFGGSTAEECAIMTRNGYMDFDFDLLFVSVGMNDSALGSVPEATFKLSLNKIIEHARARNPNCKIILCGASSTDDPNRTPYIANYRTYTSDVAASYEKDVWYVDLSVAYSSTDTGDFTEQSTPRIHPNKSGHAKIATVINNFIAANNIIL